MSILSPVWRAKLCGDIGGIARRQLALDGGEAELFRQLVNLGCGAVATMEGRAESVMALGLMARRYQIEHVQSVVEEAVVRLLTVESCGEVLAGSSGSGLAHVERASRKLALREFDAFASTAGFIRVGEEVLGSLLEDDGLRTEGEELVYEGLVRWMKGGEAREIRGAELLRKVRFPLMEGGYLAGLIKPGCGEAGKLVGLEEMVREALRLQRVAREEWGGQQLRHLDGKAVAKRQSGVNWARYAAGGGERRLDAGRPVYSVAADERFVCGGLEDGRILVWSRSTLEPVRTLKGHSGAVRALLFVRGLLASGCDDRCIRLWDVTVASGRCEGVLEGHSACVTSLALCGSRLVSGSLDGTARVWGTEGGAAGWKCEKTLVGPESPEVWCLAAWGERVACGCKDGRVLVWSSATWALERTLPRGWGCVFRMAVSGRRLIGSFGLGSVRAWSTETWECVRTVAAYPGGSGRHVDCLAVSGSALVGGSYAFIGSGCRECAVRVWDLETLEPLHELVQPSGIKMRSMVCYGAEVWGAVEAEVVVWGRHG